MFNFPILTAVDLGAVLPEFQGFLGDLRFYLGLFLLIGPLVMLVLGAWMFFKPIKTPTYKAGYRTYFGMGSKGAWRFTQWLAGLVWGGLGALLTVTMIVVCIVLSSMDMDGATSASITWLIVEAAAAFAAFIAVEVVVALRFDKDGHQRKR
jgi:hypothetical protein